MTADHPDALLNALRQTMNDPARALAAPEDPVLWVHRALRRRRSRQALLAVAAVTVLATAAAVSSAVGRDHQTQQLSVEPTPTPVPVPASYLAHLPDGTGLPGAIQELDTATGQVLHTLGQAYDPYLMNGFTVDPSHQHLYYTTLNEPAQSLDITDQALTGDPPVVLGHGSNLRISPDGHWLAYLALPDDLRNTAATPATVALRDLRNGTQRAIAVPLPAQTAQLVWLSDSRLLLLQRPPGPSGRGCAPSITTCRPPTPADPTTHLYLLDPDHDGATWATATSSGGSPSESTGPAPRAWQTYTLLAPAQVHDQVQVIDSSEPSAVLTVRLQDGAQTDRLTLPAGTQPLGFDASGQHLLFSAPDVPNPPVPAGTYTLDEHSQPLRLGPFAEEATW